MFKRFVLACVLVFGASTAQALSVNTVIPVPGVAPIVSTSGSLSSDGLGGFFFGPTAPFNATQAGTPGSFDVTVIESALVPALSQVAILFGIPGAPPTPGLFAGAPMDVQAANDGSGFVISALYDASLNLVEPAFDLFLVEITTLEQNNPLTAPFTVAVDAQISVTAVAPIPLPATLPLLVGSIGGIVLIRRRSARAA